MHRPSHAGVLATVAVAVPVAVLALRVPVLDPDHDPAVYLDAVHRMRRGDGYVAAMDASMRAFGIGPVETVRAFRLPTSFEAMAAMPSDRLVWWAYLALVVVASVAVARSSRRPLVAVAPALVLLWYGAVGYTAPDGWAGSLVLCALAWAGRRKWAAAIAVAAVATSVRELAALALAGVVLAWWGDRQSRPRMAEVLVLAAAAAGLVALAAAHVSATAPVLVAAGTGRETPLLGTGGPGSVVAMTGAWLPLGALATVAGPVSIAAALVVAYRTRRLALAGPALALPLTGLIAHRPEWGILVTPVALALAGDLDRSMVPGWHPRRVAARP